MLRDPEIDHDGTEEQQHRRARIATLCVWAVVLVFLACFAIARTVPAPPFDEAMRRDPDVNLILEGFRETPTLGDTGKWLTGTWIGKVPFWRPATSYVFWSELKAFGLDGQRLAAVSAILCVLFGAAMLWGLTPAFGVGAAGAVVMVLYTSPTLPTGHPLRVMDTIVGQWKNQPDLMAGSCLFLAVGLASRGRIAWSLLPAALSVTFKEIGFCTFLVVPAVVAWQHWQGIRPMPQQWRRAAMAYSGVVIALAVWHYLAVGVGYSLGTNACWPTRALVYYGGLPLNAILSGVWFAPVLALALLGALARGRRRPLMGLALLLGVATACVFCEWWHWEGLVARGVVSARLGLDGIATRIFVDEAPYTLSLVAWFPLAWLALRRALPLVAVSAWVTVVGAAPTFAAAQVLSHAQWLGEVGKAIVTYAAMLAVLLAVSEWVSGLCSRWPHPYWKRIGHALHGITAFFGPPGGAPSRAKPMP